MIVEQTLKDRICAFFRNNSYKLWWKCRDKRGDAIYQSNIDRIKELEDINSTSEYYEFVVNQVKLLETGEYDKAHEECKRVLEKFKKGNEDG